MDEERALELYKVFRQESPVSLTGYHRSVQQYLTLIAAILGASIAAGSAAMVLFRDCPQFALIVLLVIGLIGPGLNSWLCRLAISLSDRSYQTFLETVTILAKLEVLVGLVGERLKGAAEDTSLPFPDDKNIIPDRWLEYQNYSTAKQFVENYMTRGSNQVVRQTFKILAIAHILLSLCVVVPSILGLVGII
jgi:hypothetical protein